MARVMAGRVVVLGSLNTDFVVGVERLPAPGETVLGGDLLTNAGGKGANQAAAAARLGGRVRMVGRVGRDVQGEQLRRGLESDGVDISGVTADAEAPTGAALILVESGGQNVIAVAPGANSRLDEADVGRALLEFGPGDVLVMQLEIPLPVVRLAAAAARAAGGQVLLNAAPAGPLEGEEPPAVDVLVVNESEAQMLGQMRAERLILTLGERGAEVRDAGARQVVAAPQVEAVDTTAAGDAFVGALAVSLAAGDDLLTGARLAVLAGAAAVMRRGARESLPTRDDLTHLFGEAWRK